MRVRVRRMVSKMLCGTSRLVLAIGGDRGPAQLERENRQYEHDESTGGHGKSIARRSP